LLSAGQTFARYVIEEPIGEGGMGEVYRAHDEKLRRKVALKVMHPDLAMPDAAGRLVREARAAAALAHPNTIAIYDLGEIDGTVFIVMELVSGAPLRAFVGEPSVPVARKLQWLVDIARGLSAAHEAGLVHRDVKPANIMISNAGVVKILDFGLAKIVEASSFRTEAGIVVGTPRYMAPELLTGTKADARSDQYAFGVTAYELLSGKHPGGAMAEVPAALDTFATGVSAGVSRVVARTLSRAPADRFASMDEIAAALEEELHASHARPANAVPATRREGAGALAPTELAAGAPLLPTLSKGAPLSAELGERPSVGRVVALMALLVVAGAVVAIRMLGDPGTPTAVALVSSASASEPAAPDAMLAGGDGGARAEDAEAPSGVVAAPEDAGGGEVDAGAKPAAWPSRLDDFEDPWNKKK
jgi:serine/threonine-protein kinase